MGILASHVTVATASITDFTDTWIACYFDVPVILCHDERMGILDEIHKNSSEITDNLISITQW